MTETQTAAASYLTRTGNADLLDVLGLTEVRPRTANGRNICPHCSQPTTPGRSTCRRKVCLAAKPRRVKA